MEFDHDNVKRRAVEADDRLSSLPDDLIHKILSFFDIKFAVQTCVLSSRWESLWKSMPCLDFSSLNFRVLAKFAKFVNHVVSKHNHQVKVSSVNLRFHGLAANPRFVKKIAKYVSSHNVEQLTIRPLLCDYVCPPFLTTSKSLKDFTLRCHTIKMPFDFPALTTLDLDCIKFMCDDNDGDLFSKCVNLKSLTLRRLTVNKGFDIITPRLCDLVLESIQCLKTVNVIAPQLENLELIDCSIRYMNVSPQFSSFYYMSRVGFGAPLCFSNDGFVSLKKVSICLSSRRGLYKPYKEEDARATINMLQKLRSVRYLTLWAETLECISSFPDLLSHHSSSPFSDLICLTIDSTMMEDDAYEVIMSTEARNFLLENSPTATLIMN